MKSYGYIAELKKDVGSFLAFREIKQSAYVLYFTEGEILISYESVVGVLYDGKRYITDIRLSKTSRNHIALWCDKAYKDIENNLYDENDKTYYFMSDVEIY